jgi:GTP-binding protein
MIIKSAEFIKGIVGTNRILEDGLPQIAFIGRSNVGKSSVIASLLKRNDLVKTGKKPGKTTEINFFLINHKFYFVDLPGYGYAEGGKQKIEKIRKLIIWYLADSGARPDPVVLIIDIKAGITDFDKDMLDILRDQNHPYLIVANKTDKLNRKELQDQIKKIKEESGEENIILYSATNKMSPNVILDKLGK